MKRKPGKRRRGDRFDGRWLRDEVPAMNQFMPYLMPNRTDNEAYMKVDVDTRPIDAYLAKKNEGLTEDKYTYFHVILAAMVKTVVHRPRLNRFISGNRMYLRNNISVAFVVKKQFDDKGEEALAFKKYTKNDTIDTLHTSIMKEIHECRRADSVDNSTDFMEKLLKLPRGVLFILMKILFFLDRRGKVPYDLIKTDPNYASIFLTNLGSIGMDSGYHHLNNWGTNSFFAVIGKKHMVSDWKEDGTNDVHPVITLGLTLDERIGDGYYYSKSLKLLRKILENPEILDKPFTEKIDY